MVISDVKFTLPYTSEAFLRKIDKYDSRNSPHVASKIMHVKLI